LTRFQLPQAVQARLQFLLDRQDGGNMLSQAEHQEEEGLVKLTEFLSRIAKNKTVEFIVCFTIPWSQLAL
jgi:hypothetical protein